MSSNDPRSAAGGGQAEGAHDWVLRSRDLLERSAEDLDGATLSRLTRARHAALDSLVPAPRARGLQRWLGAAAVTAGLTLVMWRGLWPGVPDSQPPVRPLAQEVAPRTLAPTPVATPDFELLADAERYALLEELEFYAWLEKADATGNPAPGDQDG